MQNAPNERACTFAGHRHIWLPIRSELREKIEAVIDEHGVRHFYVGDNGDFDRMCAETIHEIKKSRDNLTLTLVLPSMMQRVNNLGAYYAYDYDDVLIPDISDRERSKHAITLRNRWMIDHSAFVISHLRNGYGLAWNMTRYALSQEKQIVFVAEEEELTARLTPL